MAQETVTLTLTLAEARALREHLASSDRVLIGAFAKVVNAIVDRPGEATTSEAPTAVEPYAGAPFDFDDGRGPVPAHRHPNGGGWVADTASVETAAFVGPDARVSGDARVLGSARLLGGTRVWGGVAR